MKGYRLTLNQTQREEAARIKAEVMFDIEKEIESMAQLLASRSTDAFFGETELQLRDGCHRIGLRTLQAALDGRKKGGTKGRA